MGQADVERWARSDSKRLVVVGAGACTPIAVSSRLAAAGIRLGIARLRVHPFYTNAAGDRFTVAPCPFLDEDLILQRRLDEMAFLAMRDLRQQLGEVGEEVADLFVALPLRRPGLEPGYVDDWIAGLRSEYPQLRRVEAFAGGPAAGFTALAAAQRALRSGEAEVALVGGVDSHLGMAHLRALDAAERVVIGERRTGFVPGEGAALVLITTAAVAARRGLRVRGWLGPVHTATESQVITGAEASSGDALTEVLRHTLDELPEDDRLERVYIDINGERYRNREYGVAALRCGKRLVDPSRMVVLSPSVGDVGAASVPVSITVASMWEPAYDLAAIMAGSDDGRRGCVAWVSSARGESASR